MPVDWRVEPLQRDHDRSRFDCGEPERDDYLARFARQNHESGMTRTFVAVRAAESTRILGYYSLAVGSIDKKNLSPQVARAFPKLPPADREIGETCCRSRVAGRRFREISLV